MKQFMRIFNFLSLMMMFASCGYSQNSGLASENNVLLVSYTGYENGVHKFSIKNKLACEMAVRIDDENNVIQRNMQPSEVYNVQVTGSPVSLVSVRAKKENGAECEPQPDNGWVESSSFPKKILPVKFSSFSTRVVSSNTIMVEFVADEDTDLKHYLVRVSTDGRNFRTVKIVIPEDVSIVAQKKYSILVNLDQK